MRKEENDLIHRGTYDGTIYYREDWRREEARDAGDSFYILIKTDD